MGGLSTAMIPSVSSATGEAFQLNLAFGQMGESRIARWLMSQGYSVLPVYDAQYETGKGPRVFTASGDIVAPDMMVWKGGSIRWIEAKQKTVATWYRRGAAWQTGIDSRHFDHYCKLRDTSPVPVWLMFLHTQDRHPGRDEPWPCPTGLFGNDLSILEPKARFAPQHHNGMVYWDISSLRRMATLDEVPE
jgi:hypothetical protein